MYKDHRMIDTFWSALRMYDRFSGTNFSDYIYTFTRNDNKEFHNHYGYYPVWGSGDFKESLNHYIEFFNEKGIEHFRAYTWCPNPKFLIIEEDIPKNRTYNFENITVVEEDD